MQFAAVALLFAAVTKASNVTTVTGLSSTLVTITSCGPEVTDCPAHNGTSNISTWEAGANKQYAVGAAALAAGALLAL